MSDLYKNLVLGSKRTSPLLYETTLLILIKKYGVSSEIRKKHKKKRENCVENF